MNKYKFPRAMLTTLLEINVNEGDDMKMYFSVQTKNYSTTQWGSTDLTPGKYSVTLKRLPPEKSIG